MGLTSLPMEMHHQAGSIWGSWQVAPEVALPLVALAYWIWKKSGASSKEKTFFTLGLISIIAVVQTPIGTRAGDYFTLHMIQHVTLMMVTGPLLVLGTPKSWNPRNKIFELFTHPILGWVLYALLMIGVHLPPIHNFIMMHPWAHDYIEVPLYIILPFFFYFNLLDRARDNRRISPALAVISLFLMMVPETLTGFFIYASPDSLYDGMYTMLDQQRGGSFMWAGSMIIDALWMSLAVHHWIKSEERRGREIDAQIALEKK